MKNLMFFLLAYLYVHCVIVLSTVMHMHIKLTNSFANCMAYSTKLLLYIGSYDASYSYAALICIIMQIYAQMWSRVKCPNAAA